MTETLLMLYAMFAAAGTFALLSLLGAAELHARRRRCRDAALRAKYLRIVMLYLLAGEGPAPRFPMIRRAGARLLLVETVAGLAGVTYGLDAAPYSGEPRTFPLWQTSAAACGQAALRIARKKVIPPGTIATL